MENLTAEISLMVPAEGLRSVAELQVQPSVLDGMSEDQRADPDAALSLSDEISYLLIEDTLNGLADFFADQLPGALSEGKGATYSLRSSPQKVFVTVEGQEATVDFDGRSRLTLPVQDLQALLERVAEQCDTLRGML